VYVLCALFVLASGNLECIYYPVLHNKGAFSLCDFDCDLDRVKMNQWPVQLTKKIGKGLHTVL